MKPVRRYTSHGFDSSEFSFYNLDDYREISKINPNLKITQVKRGDLRIFIADDFLIYPDEFCNFLKKFPAFANYSRNQNFSRPGMSQKFHGELFRHFEDLMIELNQSSVGGIKWCGNIFHSNMFCPTASWVPHTDTGSLFTMNYWMCEPEKKTGTMFYTWKGMTRPGLESSSEIHDEILKHEKYKPGQTWRNVDPRLIDGLEPIYYSPVKYNRVLFYDAEHLHAPWMTKDTYLYNYRYSLVGFANQE